jgi:hypothetical protein
MEAERVGGKGGGDAMPKLKSGQKKANRLAMKRAKRRDKRESERIQRLHDRMQPETPREWNELLVKAGLRAL